MIKTPTSLPGIRHNETDTDKFFAYLASHTTRSTNTQPIATISHDQSARQTWTIPQITILCILVTLTIVALWTFGTVILTAIFAAVTVLYVALLCLGTAWMIAVARAIPSTPFNDEIIHDLADAPWPSYTILCPLYREKAVVPQFVDAMKALDYPSDCLQVLFLTEEDDEETRLAILALNLPPHFQVVTVPQGTPKTKPRACNYGLQQATGDYVVIFDAEDIPDPLQLKKAILTFASNDVNVACVQAMLNFYNPVQNPLTRFFTIEYSLWFDLILPGLQHLGFSLPLGGTSNHFRVSALKALGGWDAFNVTEDCDLGLKLAKYGFRTIMLDSTTYEEANSRTFSWIKQRSRWIKGYMQTYLVHTRHPLSALKKGKIKDLLSLHLFVGAGSIVLLINPVMWAMFAVYLIWRPVDLYHHLFPWPVLYAGMLCFLVGNFLPIYVSMVACVKREQYALVKWCLFLPFYWALASVAAFLAGYELIVKPHHWHKTQHGLHLQDKKSTDKVAAIQKSGKATITGGSSQAIGTITQSVRAISTVPVPAVSKERGKRRVKARDPWFIFTIVLACICSAAATTYFFQHHELTLYADSLSHMRIARGAFDSATPGLTQLGTVWLPLPHILMIPFVWSDYLWRTGLAGSFVGMPCYIISTFYLYLSAKLLTGQGKLGFICCLVFILNPNILYLQSTPMSELVCIATFTTSCYYFLKWAHTNKIAYLIPAAGATFLATLARYDGWILSVVLFATIIAVSLIRKQSLKFIEASIIIFGSLGYLGILLWLTWNEIIFGDPFYFKDSIYSANFQQQAFLAKGLLYTYHNLWQSIRYYAIDSYQTIGLSISVLSVLCMAVFFFKKRLTPEAVATLVFLVPFVFYVFSLYIGQAIIWVPGAVPKTIINPLFNVRYGTSMIIPAALFFVLPLQWISHIKIKFVVHAVFVLCIILPVFQSLLMTRTGVLSLEDGQCGVSHYSPVAVDAYFMQHYSGGRILIYTFAFDLDEAADGIDFKNIIYEGSYGIWEKALHDPASEVDWIVTMPNDLLGKALNLNSQSFRSHFDLVTVFPGGLHLYRKHGLPPLVNRPVPSYFVNEHITCGAQNV